jgi:hypothetical protein
MECDDAPRPQRVLDHAAKIAVNSTATSRVIRSIRSPRDKSFLISKSRRALCIDANRSNDEERRPNLLTLSTKVKTMMNSSSTNSKIGSLAHQIVQYLRKNGTT